MNRLLREADERVVKYTHPDPYIVPYMPGSSKFMRNPPPPFEVRQGVRWHCCRHRKAVAADLWRPILGKNTTAPVPAPARAWLSSLGLLCAFVRVCVCVCVSSKVGRL